MPTLKPNRIARDRALGMVAAIRPQNEEMDG